MSTMIPACQPSTLAPPSPEPAALNAAWHGHGFVDLPRRSLSQLQLLEERRGVLVACETTPWIGGAVVKQRWVRNG